MCSWSSTSLSTAARRSRATLARWCAGSSVSMSGTYASFFRRSFFSLVILTVLTLAFRPFWANPPKIHFNLDLHAISIAQTLFETMKHVRVSGCHMSFWTVHTVPIHVFDTLFSSLLHYLLLVYSTRKSNVHWCCTSWENSCQSYLIITCLVHVYFSGSGCTDGIVGSDNRLSKFWTSLAMYTDMHTGIR